MTDQNYNNGLLDFLGRSPTPFHAVEQMAEMLAAADFVRLKEEDAWQLEPRRGYFVTRNGSSLIALRTGSGSPSEQGLRLIGAHTDSPCLKVKPAPEMIRQGCFQLSVEIYGGVLLGPWFDRDLSLALSLIHI